MNAILRAALFAAYLVSIVAGVWAIDAFGIVQVAPGIFAPAAVYVVGLTLVLRDLLQEATGRGWAFLAVALGAGLSAFVNPGLALASGIAFLASESLDLAIYSKIRERGSILSGMLVSNAVSIPVDSVIFLGLAFGSFEFLAGQMIGKAVASLLAIAVLTAIGSVAALIHDRKVRAARAREEERLAGLSYTERRMEQIRRSVTHA